MFSGQWCWWPVSVIGENKRGTQDEIFSFNSAPSAPQRCMFFKDAKVAAVWIMNPISCSQSYPRGAVVNPESTVPCEIVARFPSFLPHLLISSQHWLMIRLWVWKLWEWEARSDQVSSHSSWSCCCSRKVSRCFFLPLVPWFSMWIFSDCRLCIATRLSTPVTLAFCFPIWALVAVGMWVGHDGGQEVQSQRQNPKWLASLTWQWQCPCLLLAVSTEYINVDIS